MFPARASEGAHRSGASGEAKGWLIGIETGPELAYHGKT
jgi:hypothetical protein